ncbi:MAG: metallophosphoesterase family protein, partial [Lachnospiraceae bacterium]|nr:metallophosphoesterase family protein [Lachnospiraceae bacterium]
MKRTLDNMIFDEEVDFSDRDIKKVLFVSDSHGDILNLRKVFARLNKHVDLIIHLGDLEVDPTLIAVETTKDIIFLKGNMDYDYRLPKNVILKIKGHKLFLSHGVGYMGEYSLGEMRLTAENNGCDVIAMG